MGGGIFISLWALGIESAVLPDPRDVRAGVEYDVGDLPTAGLVRLGVDFG